MYALGVLRAHFGTVSAQDTAALDDLCMMIDHLDRLDGALSEALITVFTAGVFEIEIIDHNGAPALLADARIDLREEQFFAVIFVGIVYEDFIREHADAVLAVSHAEARLQIHFILYPVLFDEALHFLNHVVRSPKMTGASDTNFDDHNNNLSIKFIYARAFLLLHRHAKRRAFRFPLARM